jgi:hypothetical protein
MSYAKHEQNTLRKKREGEREREREREKCPKFSIRTSSCELLNKIVQRQHKLKQFQVYQPVL